MSVCINNLLDRLGKLLGNNGYYRESIDVQLGCTGVFINHGIYPLDEVEAKTESLFRIKQTIRRFFYLENIAYPFKVNLLSCGEFKITVNG